MCIPINGQDILVKGAVVSMLADTQAAHSIGGFKIGVGFAFRKCRNCLATQEMMSSMVKRVHIHMYMHSNLYTVIFLASYNYIAWWLHL